MKNALLDQLIVDLIAEHEGGEKFFDHLDEAIRTNDSILQALLETINKAFSPVRTWEEWGYTFIVSGRFGRMLANFMNQNNYPYNVVTVNGNLRHGDKIDDLSYLNLHKNCIFVDDSFYLGRTRNAIKEELERCGATLIQTFVVYDGSKVKDEAVTSLYRFFS